MGNIMTSMYTGVAGLRTNQSSLNTVSHNLANVNTEGYVRQQIVTQDTIYNSIGASSVSMLQVGYGTNIQTIRQVRDVFLDKAYRVEVGREGFYKSQSEATQEIETLFGELEGEAFHDDISEFWTALQELAKEPDSIVKRAAVVSQASTLIERATSISSALSDYQKNLNTNILQKVDRINQIGEQIESLNRQIVRYESGSENANDLRDSRNLLLDELSELVKISYSEDSTGNVNVMIEGRQFVWDGDVYGLTTIAEQASELITVVWDDGKNTPLYDLTQECKSENNSNIGSLKGVLIARGDERANYTDIPVQKEGESDDDYKKRVEDYNKNTAPSILETTQAQFDQLLHGMVTAINDILSPNVDVDGFLENMGYGNQNVTITTVDGEAVDLDSVKLWDEANAPVGMDPDQTPRQELFERKYTERYTEATMTYTDAEGNQQTKTVYVYNEEDPNDIYSLYTLGQIRVNEEIQKEVSLLPLSGTTNQGLTDAFDLDRCQALVDVFNQKFSTLSPNELTKYTFSDYYTAFIGGIATKGNMFETMAEKQEDVATNIDNQRSNLLGVSSEEELTNMIKYQYAYAANSKYINVINDMLETIINRLG